MTLPWAAARRAGAATAACILALVGAASAQDSTCTYDRCALRIRYRPFASQIVQGEGALPVARMGLFSVRIMPLEAAGGPVQAHYQQSRASQDLAALLGILGGAALLGSTYAWTPFDESPNGTWIPLLVVGGGLMFARTLELARSRDALQQAIWHYNRGLAGSP